ncbi:MAG: hypothetical protein D6714_04860, partial [Bacteroidetes bacterium]
SFPHGLFDFFLGKTAPFSSPAKRFEGILFTGFSARRFVAMRKRGGTTLVFFTPDATPPPDFEPFIARLAAVFSVFFLRSEN